MIKIKIDSRAVEKELGELNSKKLPFALALGLTRIATTMQRAETAAIGQLDRPKPLTAKAALFERATMATLAARVFIRDSVGSGTPPSSFLSPVVHGGKRPDKRSERALGLAGLLPAGQQIAPGAGVRRDRHGNVSRAQTKAAIGGAKGSGSQYFTVTKARGKLAPGVYQRRRRGAPKSIFNFIPQPSYQAGQFDFFGVAEKTFNREWSTTLSKAIADALKPKA